MERCDIYKGYVFMDGEYNEYTVLNRNDGGIVYCLKWELGDDDNLRLAGEVALTLEEIRNLMKSYDGKNHKVNYVYKEDLL